MIAWNLGWALGTLEQFRFGFHERLVCTPIIHRRLIKRPASHSPFLLVTNSRQRLSDTALERQQLTHCDFMMSVKPRP